ncbi:MAG: lasso peptide biosynthesis B2 protein [Acidobacteriota bacterium]
MPPIGSGRLLVELHWDWITPRLPAGDVSEDKEALLVYLCRHAGKHFWCSPQWCCDIELYLRKFEEQLDWERFWKLAKKVEAERSCAASFQLCALLFGRALRSEQTQVANRAARKLSAAAARQMFEGPSQGWRKRPLVRLLQVYNWKQRIRRFWGWLAPAPKHWTHAGRSSEPTLEVWIGRYRRLALRLAARALPAGLWRGRFQKASELSTRDWMWLGRAYGTLILVRLALRALPFEKVSGWATRVGPKSRPSEDLEPSVLRRAWLADVAADHHLVEMSCLPRALALTRMLGQAGVPCELKLGVRHQDGKVAGHAWVQWRGRPLNDPNAPHQQYEELTPVGAAKRIAEIDAGSGE